ncbi:recombinase family protein [Chloroflexales bacterium ZM16-3]|nr:recombinase family protein [Chloroflexales bacterium ZM16-3]
MKRAAIYRRISTAHQEDNTSLESQLRECKRYAAERQMVIIADFADIESGEDLFRPGFQQLEALVKQKSVDVVIVSPQDRLSRNLIDTLTIIQTFTRLGVEIHDTTVEGPVSDDLRSVIMAVLAAEEKKTIRQRMLRGMNEKARQGKIIGQGDKAPYGYRFEGKQREKVLLIHEDEAQTVQRIYQWYVHEHLSIRAITGRLTAQRIPTPRDNGRVIAISASAHTRSYGQWNPSSVSNILTGTVYKGIIYHNRYLYERQSRAANRKPTWQIVGERPEEEWIPISVPAIVSEALWAQTQARLKTGKQLAARNTKREYLLRCRIRCACGYAMCGHANRTHRYYRCGGSSRYAAKPCTESEVRVDRLDQLVWDWLSEQVTPEKLIAGLYHERTQRTQAREVLQGQRDLVERQLAEAASHLARINEGFVGGLFSLEEAAQQKGRVLLAARSLEGDITELDAKLADTGPSDDEAEALLAYIIDLYTEMAQVKSYAERRWFIDTLDVRAQIEVDDEGNRWVRFSGRLALEGRKSIDAIVSRGHLPPGPPRGAFHPRDPRI